MNKAADREKYRIAEQSGTTLKIKKYVMAYPEQVVAEALRDSYWKRTMSVCSLPIKRFHSADGIAPDGQMADPVIFAVGSKDTVEHEAYENERTLIPCRSYGCFPPPARRERKITLKYRRNMKPFGPSVPLCSAMSKKGVSTGPGQTLVTVIPMGLSSSFSALEKLST